MYTGCQKLFEGPEFGTLILNQQMAPQYFCSAGLWDGSFRVLTTTPLGFNMRPECKKFKIEFHKYPKRREIRMWW